MRFRRILLTAASVLILGPAGLGAQSVPAAYDGAAATGLALRQLGTTARVLHIAAHPDDENTALFAPLALGRGIDAAYLSLTRGEGGQNGIGPELGVALGVVRSEELLAARRLDGGDQFFARAIDYGYSKNAEEAFRHWPREILLADAVEIIRRYRPDVVVSVWSGTPRDGHGQHEAAGIIAREATLAAGDPTRFPEQIAAGLRPHTPALYYRSAWFSADDPDAALNTGRLDPLLGASYHQIAMASRSRHRSQDQGRPLDPGPRYTAFDRVDPAAPVEVAESRSWGRYGDGPPPATASLFEGVDTLLSQRAARLSPGDDRDRLVQELRTYEAEALAARDAYDPFEPWGILHPLLNARSRLVMVRDDFLRTRRASDRRNAFDAPAADLRFHIDREIEDLETAILLAGNLELDAVADEALVVPGQTFRLELSAWNGGPEPVRVGLRPALPTGWSALPVDTVGSVPMAGGSPRVSVEPGQRAAVAFDVTVPADAELTQPYYLNPRGPRPDDLYDWPDDHDIRGLPFAPPPVRAAFTVAFPLTDDFRVVRDAERIGVDAREGQYREPVKVVPPVSVELGPSLAIVPLSATDRALPFTVRLRSQADAGVTGTLRPVLPAGWSAEPASIDVDLPAGGPETALSFAVTPPPGIEAGEYGIGVELLTGGGRYDLGYDVVDYPHIAPHHLFEPARAQIRALDVEVADVRVGYVPGAGDGVPEALDQLGVEWSLLDAAALAGADLSAFDVIVTGIRAYEVNDDLVAHNQRLLDWARRGGTLVAQYNKYPALQRDYTPWPVTISRPHGRVTDETAPVTVLEPDHPIFTTPNPIGAPDWRGWVQERGLYFWETWDGPMTPLLAMADPGEDPLTGSLLVAPLGEGTYVYAALAFFRQLPEGVPGAYRLLANLISLGADQ